MKNPMTISDAISKLPPSPHALDWMLAALAEGMTIVDALAFTWGQYDALNQQRPAFIRGIRE